MEVCWINGRLEVMSLRNLSREVGIKRISLYEIGSGTGCRYIMHPQVVVVVVVHSVWDVVMKAHATAVNTTTGAGPRMRLAKMRLLSRYKAGIYR